MAEAHEARVGERVGRYRIVRHLASGGMGTVYLGRAESIGGFERAVAIKVCHAALRADPAFAALFLDEARLAARVHSPHVVPTLDVGHEGDLLYLVMEYVEGVSLAEATSASRATRPVALRIVLDVLAGLGAAHALGLVHRDVSPQNVLVGSDGAARLVDFGIARAGAASRAGRGDRAGKLGYMAPEQLRDGAVDTRADLYAAGVVLWELCAARRLYRRDAAAELVNAVLHESAPLLAIVPGCEEVAPALGAAVARATSKSASARFTSADEMAAAIERADTVASHRDVAGWVGASCGALLRDRRVSSAIESPVVPERRVVARSARIKGAAISELLRWYVREHRGDPRRLAAAVPRDLADALDPSKDGLGIVASGWYDARIVHALLEAFVAAFPDQELSAMARAASLAGLRSNAGGIYKVVLERLASPGIYARSIQRLWRLLHDTGERTIEIERPGRAVSRIRDWAGHHPMLCVMTNGTMAAMFETMRCRDVRIARVACVSEGAPECVAIVTWSEGDARAW